MRKISCLLLTISTLIINAQVGINTETPEATFEVVGKPNDLNHYDGIIFPKISGNQLAVKTYNSAKKGSVVYVTSPPSNLSGQVINVSKPSLYYFDGSVWQNFSASPIEYLIILSFDSDSTAGITLTSGWSLPNNYWGNSNNYLTALKTYTIGTKNFGGLKGEVQFRKLYGSVNVKFQIYRSYDSSPITGNAFINISNIFNDLGYVPNQIVNLHTENSTQHFPALLENYAIQIPQTSLSSMSTSFYTYGEAQGYSSSINP